MLSEVGKIRPAVLIIWKTDWLGRDRYDLAIAKKLIRDAGCNIYYIAEPISGDAPETAPFVQKIFEDYAAGRTTVDIARELNSIGLKTARDKPFTVNSIAHILNNRAYIGEYHYGDIVKPDGMPAIITPELFEAAQKRLILNKRQGGQRANLLRLRRGKKAQMPLEVCEKGQNRSHRHFMLTKCLQDTELLASLAVDVAAYSVF